jgi:hypothetical protein
MAKLRAKATGETPIWLLRAAVQRKVLNPEELTGWRGVAATERRVKLC